MNSHDIQPEYDMNFILQLLRACLQDDQPAFWAKVLHEHQVKSVLTNMDPLHTDFIRHIFSGTCVLCPGSECKAVMSHEQWPQSMGICVINNTLQWLEQDALSVEEFTCICKALNILPTGKNNKTRSLVRKLVDY